MEAVDMNVFIDDKLKSSDVYKEGNNIWMDFNNIDDCFEFVCNNYEKIKSISYGGKNAIELAKGLFRIYFVLEIKHPDIYIHSKNKKTRDSIIEIFKEYNNK